MSTVPLLQHLQPSSEERPSIFELLATDELRDLVQPAFRYVLAYLAQRYPRYLLRLVNRHEEVYAGVILGVEGYHLHKLGSTFADHFYQLKYRSTRVHTNGTKTTGLSRNQKMLILASIVGIPYARAKLKDLYERLGGGLDPEIAQSRIENDPRGSLQNANTSRLKLALLWLFKLFYPYLNFLYTLTEVGYDLGYAYNLGYLSPTTSTTHQLEWRPWMQLLGIAIVRNTTPSPPTLSTRLTGSIFPMTLLALKFSQWWYSPFSPRLSHVENEKENQVWVPPPKMVRPGKKGWSDLNVKRIAMTKSSEDTQEDEEEAGSDTDSLDTASTESLDTPPASPLPVVYGRCPLCSLPWANPSTTPTGYVACYTCLFKFIEKEGKCPVTGIELKQYGGVESLRKVLV